jgi:TatD DNase family protein
MNYTPAESDLIDIHSHSGAAEPGLFRILNIFTHDFTRLPENQAVSVGLHPWYIDEGSESTFEGILIKTAGLPQVMAIGETGLDKLCSIPMEKQEAIFRVHIRIANEVRKPLIIHCVRAYPELTGFRKLSEPGIAWVVHGFSGKTRTAEELVEKDFYLSVGNRMLMDRKKSREFCSVIPMDHIFVETDDDKVPLEEIYRETAELYHVTVPALKKSILGNYMKVFKR